MSRYGHGYGEVPQFRSVNYNHLMPPGPYDTSTMQSPSSGQSPMSPSSSVGPDHVQDSIPFLEVPPYMPEDPSHSLIGISPRLANENFTDIEFSFDDALGTSPLSHQPVFPPQTDASSGHPVLERLRSALERLETTVQEIASHPGFVPLYDVKSILKHRYSRLEATIQARIDCNEQPNISCKLKDRYLCKLCSVADRKVYSSRGVFRRHVSAKHHPRSIFVCPSRSCSFDSPRRDKMSPHLKMTHSYPRKLRRDEINRLERHVPPPTSCELCYKSVDGWEEYFKCISDHCRLREDDSTYTSASQSRRSSGDSGSGANGGGSNFNGGGFLGGSQNLFPFGGWNGQMNGSSFNSSTDQNYFSQASSYSNELDSASFGRQSLPGMLGSGPAKPISFKKQTSRHSVYERPSRNNDVRRESEANRCHRPSLLRSVTESSWSSTDAESDVQSPSRITPSGGIQSDDHPLRQNLLADMLKKHLQKPATPKPDVLDKKKCRNCDHIISDCTSCQSLQLNVDKCHLCMDQSCQVLSRHPNKLPNCGFPEAAVGLAADCTGPEDLTVQVSDRRLQDGLQTSQHTKCLKAPETNSSLTRDDGSLSDTFSIETMDDTDTTMTISMNGHDGKQTVPSETSNPSDSSLSMIPALKHPSSSINDAPTSGIQQQLKLPVTRALSYPALPEPKPLRNLHHGLGIYANQRPKFILNQSFAFAKTIPCLVLPSECLKPHKGMLLSTEMSASIRHGRPKPSRLCGTHSHFSRECPQICQMAENEEEAGSPEDSHDGATNSLDLITLSTPTLNQRLKHLNSSRLSNRPIPSKHILSRKKCHTLRTKLQVLVEMLALRKSSKAPVLDPEEPNAPYLESLIPRGNYLKSPVFDFDLSCLDIPSSLPLLLETLFLLQTDPKGNTSTKLTNYIYDHDDEMHLMLLILIPLLTKLLWMPSPSVDTAIVAAVERLEI